MTGYLIALALWFMVACAEYGRSPHRTTLSRGQHAELVLTCAFWPVLYVVVALSVLREDFD